MTLPQSAGFPPEGEKDRPRRLRPEVGEEISRRPAAKEGGSGPDLDGAGKIVDALRASADQEFNIAERLSGKARQSFALAAGFFIVAQTVAFGGFEATKLSAHEKNWIIALAIASVAALASAVFTALKADATYKSRDLPLETLEDDLNAAYEGKSDVIGKLGGYYLGIVRTRREANARRREWYQRTRVAVIISLLATVSELVFSLVSRAS